MYLVIGNENCSRCEIVKNKLKNDGIPFEYILLSDFSEDERKHYIALAREAKQMAMPLIIKDDKVIALTEVR
jgi:glutaredoxin